MTRPSDDNCFFPDGVAARWLIGMLVRAKSPAPSYGILQFLEDFHMQLGTFSMSLAVKDLSASKAFYQKLGFDVMGDYSEQGWAILSNGTV
ncbi:MAG: hypothetical protein AAF722_16865, partial [Cyanobacteria bacterium P01_C01_bin.70]